MASRQSAAFSSTSASDRFGNTFLLGQCLQDILDLVGQRGDARTRQYCQRPSGMRDTPRHVYILDLAITGARRWIAAENSAAWWGSSCNRPSSNSWLTSAGQRQRYVVRLRLPGPNFHLGLLGHQFRRDE